MPVHNGWLPREGLTADPIFSLLGKTVLNPACLLPLILAARYTKKGEDLSILHPLAFSRLKTLLYVGLAKWLSAKFSERVVNNFASDTYDWPNEIAVVTGGAGGIGGHVVRLLAERGVKVVVLDIQPMSFETGPEVHYYKCDLTSVADIKEVAARVRADVGDPTILVNNAGIARGKTILGTSERDLKLTFDVNVFAHFYTVHEFLPAMVRRDHGMVVTVASYAAWLTVPNMVDYGASKAAAASFHEGLAAELKTRYQAPRVRTVLVNQGYTKTALFTGYHNEAPFLVPALEPESVADAIVRQIFSGRSGQIITPAFGTALQMLRALPHWYSYRLRSKGENIMSNFNGRQVVKDADKHYEGRDKKSPETEESTVLVPEEK
ncbi:short chain dehydrogenase [Apiospora marii]|uniref:Short chain dehydrogenase n=1 Tax=Apiospora marii TaxID=335849 RepID=A0ABR1SFP3_9PEZI